MNEPFVDIRFWKEESRSGYIWGWNPDIHDYSWVEKKGAIDYKGVLEKAVITLTGIVKQGPIDANMAYYLMSRYGFSERTIKRAKDGSGIKSVKRPKTGEVLSTWTWYIDGQKPLGVDWEKEHRQGKSMTYEMVR